MNNYRVINAATERVVHIVIECDVDQLRAAIDKIDLAPGEYVIEEQVVVREWATFSRLTIEPNESKEKA